MDRSFQKLKFSKNNVRNSNYLTEYEKNVIKSKIFLEIDLKLAVIKSFSARSSAGAIDLLGDIGGF